MQNRVGRVVISESFGHGGRGGRVSRCDRRRGRTPSGRTSSLIMSDDMGFSDLGCYGGEIQTPNLDRLAAERPAVHPVLQHGPLLPDAGLAC